MKLFPNNGASANRFHAPLFWAWGLGVIAALSMALPPYPLFYTPAAFLSLHTLFEVVTIAMSLMICLLGWGLSKDVVPKQVLILSSVFLAVALIDLAHTFSYPGMPTLITPSSPEKAINFWLAGRLVTIIGLLVVAFVPAQDRWEWWSIERGTLSGIAIAIFIGYMGIYHADVFPRTFVDGQGLTTFKVVVEYIFFILCVLAAWVFARRAKLNNDVSLAFLAVAAWTMGLSELFFARYLTTSDLMNVLGHCYKVASTLMIYRALFTECVNQPYLQLAKSQSQLESTVQTLSVVSAAFDSREGIVITDAHSHILRVNQAFSRITGYSEAEVIGLKPKQLQSGRHGPQFYRDMWDKLLQDGHWAGEILNKRKNGEIYPAWLVISAINNANGQVQYYVANLADSSEHKKIENELRIASLYARSLIEASLDPLVTINAEGKITDVNSATENVTGVAREQLIGSDFSTYFTEPDKAREGYRQVFSQGYVTDYPLAIRHRFGKITEVLYNANLYRDNEGNVLGAFAAARDVTGRNKAIDALRESERFAYAALNALSAHIAILDHMGTIVAVNQAWREFAAQNSLLHANVWEGINYLDVCEQARGDSSENAMAIAEGIRAVMRGETHEFVLEYPCHAPEEKRWFVAHVTRFPGDGEVRVVVSHENVTARKLAEQVLRATSLYARSLIEASLDPLVTISTEGKITDVNSATEHVTGIDRRQLVGSDFSTYFTEPDNARKGYQQVFSQGYVTDYPLAIRHSSGKITDVLYNASVYRDSDGNVLGVFAAARDVTERKKAEDAVHAASLYARSLIEASLDPLVTINAEGTITDVNSATENVTGVAREQLIGSDFSTYFTEPDKAREGYQQVFLQGYVTDYPLAIRHRSGKITDVLYNASVYSDSSGNALGVFAAARDVTERNKAEQELIAYRDHLEELVNEQTEDLRRAKEVAEDANRTKSEFLANMSHEIRTPMNGVVGMVDILQTTELSHAQKRMTNTIRASSLALLTILDDILDYSKIEAGKLNVESVPCHLRELIEGVAELVAPWVSAKALELMVFVPTDIPDVIQTDPVRLRQILLNLLGNAVKFTKNQDGLNGQVILRASFDDRSAANPVLRFQIIDNGIGISEEQLSRLFQPFSQADVSTTRRFGGTGLGLCITKRLVELLDGQLKVTSGVGVGSEFMVELPLVIGQADTASNEQPRLDGLTVFAVLQNPLFEEILGAYLGALGAKVTLVSCLEAAQNALDSLGEGEQGEILLDLSRSPESTADQIIQMSNQQGTMRPVIRLMSRKSSQSTYNNLIVATNPMLQDDLVCMVAVAADRLTLKDSVDLTDQRHRQRVISPSIEEAEQNGQLILVAEDNEINCEVLQEQLSLLGYASEVAMDGVEALERWRSGCYALLLTDCHMPNMDGFQLTEAIRAEERQGKRIPIIAVTANAMQGEAERCMENGMDDYLSKPVRLDKLGTTLAKWLPLTVKTEAFQDDAEVGDNSAIWDSAALSRLVGNNPGIHHRLLDKFLINAEQQIATIRASGIEDAALVAAEAHKLKSSSRSVGAMQLGELCQKLEDAGRAGDIQAIRLLEQKLESAFRAVSELIGKG